MATLRIEGIEFPLNRHSLIINIDVDQIGEIIGPLIIRVNGGPLTIQGNARCRNAIDIHADNNFHIDAIENGYGISIPGGTKMFIGRISMNQSTATQTIDDDGPFLSFYCLRGGDDCVACADDWCECICHKPKN